MLLFVYQLFDIGCKSVKVLTATKNPKKDIKQPIKERLVSRKFRG